MTPHDQPKYLTRHVPLYIFDLDGTLANNEHRQHILQSSDSDRWDKFFEACSGDKPKWPVIATMESLRLGGADILIWSGRSDSVRDKTIAWLDAHIAIPGEELDQILQMRPRKDHTPDDTLKFTWYSELSTVDKARLVAVFDDRNKVVQMWRNIGVTCFQVAEGDF